MIHLPQLSPKLSTRVAMSVSTQAAKVRAWMTANSWIVSEIVIAFFLVLFLF